MLAQETRLLPTSGAIWVDFWDPGFSKTHPKLLYIWGAQRSLPISPSDFQIKWEIKTFKKLHIHKSNLGK